MKFKSQQILQQRTVGDLLRAARQDHGYSLADLAYKLKITEKYLYALEQGKYHDLPSPVYVRNYARLYAKELDVDWSRIGEQLAAELLVFAHASSVGDRPSFEETGATQQSRQLRRQAQTATAAHRRQALVIPRLVKIGLAGVGVLLVSVYFAWQVVQFLSPPELSVVEPAEDMMATQRVVTIVGQSEPEAIVELNGQLVGLELDGSFREEVALQDGLNTIRVIARSKSSSERVVIRNILYQPQN